MFQNISLDPDVLTVYQTTVVVGDGTILAEFAKKAVESAPAQMSRMEITVEELEKPRVKYLPRFRVD